MNKIKIIDNKIYKLGEEIDKLEAKKGEIERKEAMITLSKFIGKCYEIAPDFSSEGKTYARIIKEHTAYHSKGDNHLLFEIAKTNDIYGPEITISQSHEAYFLKSIIKEITFDEFEKKREEIYQMIKQVK